MGRTLVKAISDIKGFALAGVLEDTRSPLIGWDAGTLAGTPENGVKLTGDAAALIDKADGIVDFTAPVATVGFAELAAKSGKIHIIGTTGLSAADEARIKEAAVSGGAGGHRWDRFWDEERSSAIKIARCPALTQGEAGLPGAPGRPPQGGAVASMFSMHGSGTL